MTSFVPKSSNGLRKEGTVSGGVSSDPNHHTNDPPGSSRRNGHRAASRAAKGSGIAKFVARLRSLREATCRPHTRGRKLVTRLAARLVSEVREYIPFHNLFRNDEN